MPAGVRALEELCFSTVSQKRGRVALLIGAGCSRSAGIPLANEIVDMVWKAYAGRCRELHPDVQRDYNFVTGVIEEPEFLDLLRPSLRRSKVNFAHLCVAELIAQGVVDRVLTTNFDPLLIRACAMVRQFPAIYDCVAVQFNDLRRVFGEQFPQIYYLHGQTHGLRILNRRNELQDHAAKSREILDAICERRTLIVAGYSGRSDDLLQQLRTETTVFWLAHTEREAEIVREACSRYTRRWVIAGCDADRFFYDLLHALKIQMPLIARDPAGFASGFASQIRWPSWLRSSQAHPKKRETGSEKTGTQSPQRDPLTGLLMPAGSKRSWTRR